MKEYTISIDKQSVTDQVIVGIANKTHYMEFDAQMSEHDSEWVEVELGRCARVVWNELLRVPKDKRVQKSIGGGVISFTLLLGSAMQGELLASAIGRYMVEYLCEQWCVANLNMALFSSVESLRELKHITLRKF